MLGITNKELRPQLLLQPACVALKSPPLHPPSLPHWVSRVRATAASSSTPILPSPPATHSPRTVGTALSSLSTPNIFTTVSTGGNPSPWSPPVPPTPPHDVVRAAVPGGQRPVTRGCTAHLVPCTAANPTAAPRRTPPGPSTGAWVPCRCLRGLRPPNSGQRWLAAARRARVRCRGGGRVQVNSTMVGWDREGTRAPPQPIRLCAYNPAHPSPGTCFASRRSLSFEVGYLQTHPTPAPAAKYQMGATCQSVPALWLRIYTPLPVSLRSSQPPSPPHPTPRHPTPPHSNHSTSPLCRTCMAASPKSATLAVYPLASCSQGRLAPPLRAGTLAIDCRSTLLRGRAARDGNRARGEGGGMLTTCRYVVIRRR